MNAGISSRLTLLMLVTSRARTRVRVTHPRTMDGMADGDFIENPFAQGDEVVVPRGTVVHSTHPSRYEYVITRRQVVTVRYADPGYWLDNRAKLPQVEWVSGDGYHRNAQVTPHLLRENGVEMTVPLAETDEWKVNL